MLLAASERVCDLTSRASPAISVVQISPSDGDVRASIRLVATTSNSGTVGGSYAEDWRRSISVPEGAEVGNHHEILGQIPPAEPIGGRPWSCFRTRFALIRRINQLKAAKAAKISVDGTQCCAVFEGECS